MSILSRLACEWAVRSFGRDHVANAPTRALRILEEAAELCQAFQVPQEIVDLCTKTVYSQPPGYPVQEIGGVLLTTNILCAALGNVEPDDVLEMELARVLAKPPEHFAKRNQEKVDAGLNVPQGLQFAGRDSQGFELFRNAETGKTFRQMPDGKMAEVQVNQDGLIDGAPICPSNWDPNTTEIFHNPATGKYFRTLANGETAEITQDEIDKLKGRA